MTSLVAQLVKNLPAVWETWVSSLGWEDALEKGKEYLLQYPGLENSMDLYSPWVAKSRTWLSNFHFSLVLTTSLSLLEPILVTSDILKNLGQL